MCNEREINRGVIDSREVFMLVTLGKREVTSSTNGI